MTKQEGNPRDNLLIRSLQERAKELRCIYEFEELFKNYENKPLNEFFEQVMLILPPAFQFPEICRIVIRFDGKEYSNGDCDQNTLYLQSPIVVDDKTHGYLRVCYEGSSREVCFLPEEKNLVNTIARRIGRFVFYRRLRENIDVIKDASESKRPDAKKDTVTDNGHSYRAWRMEMAENVAENLNPETFGVKALYVIGSTKTGHTGPASDIDLLAHCTKDEKKQELFKSWIDGWGKCLSIVHKEMTGVDIPDSMIDLHIITDDDIKQKTSFAVMLTSVSNSAQLLKDYRK